MRNTLQALIALSVVALSLFGCASGGGGGASSAAADVAPAEPEVDIKDEVGENGLLSPAAILARYVDVLGGEEALRANESATVKGKMFIDAMGIEGDVTIYAAAPDRFVMNIDTPMGAMNQGYNGEVGWSDNPMTGPSVLDGAELAEAKNQADFYGELTYADRYSSMETVELTEFAGESAYKLKLTGAEGKETTQYFSEASSLLLGQEAVQAGPMGESEVTITFSDYQEFGGRKRAGTTTILTSGMEIRQTVSEVTYDDVEDSSFEPPASIKGMLE